MCLACDGSSALPSQQHSQGGKWCLWSLLGMGIFDCSRRSPVQIAYEREVPCSGKEEVRQQGGLCFALFLLGQRRIWCLLSHYSALFIRNQVQSSISVNMSV